MTNVIDRVKVTPENRDALTALLGKLTRLRGHVQPWLQRGPIECACDELRATLRTEADVDDLILELRTNLESDPRT